MFVNARDAHRYGFSVSLSFSPRQIFPGQDSPIELFSHQTTYQPLLVCLLFTQIMKHGAWVMPISPKWNYIHHSPVQITQMRFLHRTDSS